MQSLRRSVVRCFSQVHIDRAKQENLAYLQWLKTKSDAYRNPPTSTAYLGGTIPFPTNPYYKPIPPATDAEKERIFVDYKKLSLRELAVKYKKSIRTIEGILKLKGLEKEMESKGKPLQVHFQKEMESMLCAGRKVADDPVSVYPGKNRPVWVAVDEVVRFKMEDAMAILGEAVPVPADRPCPLEKRAVTPADFSKERKGRMWWFKDRTQGTGVVWENGVTRAMTEKELGWQFEVPQLKNRFVKWTRHKNRRERRV